jgi:hypothetical protein
MINRQALETPAMPVANLVVALFKAPAAWLSTRLGAPKVHQTADFTAHSLHLLGAIIGCRGTAGPIRGAQDAFVAENPTFPLNALEVGPIGFDRDSDLGLARTTKGGSNTMEAAFVGAIYAAPACTKSRASGSRITGDSSVREAAVDRPDAKSDSAPDCQATRIADLVDTSSGLQPAWADTNSTRSSSPVLAVRSFGVTFISHPPQT